MVPVPDVVPLHDRSSRSLRSAVEVLPSIPDGSAPSGGFSSLSAAVSSALRSVQRTLLPAVTTDPVTLVLATIETLEAVASGVLGAAVGPLGLLAVLAYSFLVAFALPLPGELVLAVPVGMGLSPAAALLVVVLVSSAGKAVGSLAVLRVGRGAGLPVLDRLPDPPSPTAVASGAPAVASGTSRIGSRLAGLGRRYGYVGLTAALAIPFAPDTAVLYAFSVFDTDRATFAAAAFVGSALRLSIVAGLASAAFALV
jgi:membrane protein YqaA with SNARE-associated domain